MTTAELIQAKERELKKNEIRLQCEHSLIKRAALKKTIKKQREFLAELRALFPTGIPTAPGEVIEYRFMEANK